jgi:DNA primase
VRGNFDVVALHQSASPIHGSLGTSFTEEQAKLLRRYCTSVEILFDSDGADRVQRQNRW